MKILVACEFSGVVRRAFRDRGHDAWSCDLLPAEDNSPFHITGDVLPLLGEGWDMMIAHPPCTYLTVAGARYRNNPERLIKQREAVIFFQQLQAAPISKIAIENPIPFKTVSQQTGPYTQIVEPFHFGEPIKKRICLWLTNLPLLIPTNTVTVKPSGFCIRKSGPRAGKRYNYYFHQSKDGHARSRFFPGIAATMASQWG